MDTDGLIALLIKVIVVLVLLWAFVQVVEALV